MWSSIKWLLGRASDAERAAWREFRKDHLVYIPWVDTVAEEPTRVIVRIRFTPNQQPTFYRFYAVDRETLKAELIVDDSAYPPSNRLK